MNEAPNIRTQITINAAKIEALRLYGDRFEKSLHVLAESLARDGYSQAEIAEAMLATMPTLEAGCEQIQTAIDDFAAKALADG
jgi:hypothetical protein